MSQTQPWPLSQDANQRKGICSVCFATRQLKNIDGTVHRHGPRQNPCSGSDKPPLKTAGTTTQLAVAGADIPSQPDLGQASCSNTTSTSTALGTPTAPGLKSRVADSTTGCSIENTNASFMPVNYQLIKHIPKSASPACSSQLATLLSAVVAKPDDTSTWISLMAPTRSSAFRS